MPTDSPPASIASVPEARGADARLVRALGVWGLAAGVINITIGGGIFRLPAHAAALLGDAAPLAYVACAVLMGLIVLCFAESGSRVPLTGGQYASVEVALGPLVGLVSGVLLWVGLTAASAAVATFFADSVAALVPALAPTGARWALIVAVFSALAWLNIAGVKGAGRFNAVMTVAKLVPLVAFIVVGLTAIDPSRVSAAGATPASVGTTSAILIFAFLGVESALIPSGEVRDPERTIPRAILIAIAAVTIIYILVHLIAQSALGSGLATSETPVADAAGVVMGTYGRTLILIGSAVSMFGYVSGMTLSVPRMLFAFGRDGFLPPFLASVHPTFRTPHAAIVVQTVINVALALTGTFKWLAVVANGSVLLVYAACCVATMVLRRRNVVSGATPFRVPGAAAIPVLALAGVLAVFASLPRAELIAVVAVVPAAAILFAFRRSRGAPA